KFFKLELISIEKVIQQLIDDVIKKHHIHKGESSFISLAKKYNVDYCLTNEIKARNVIKSESFKVIGTLGIILKAYSIEKIKKQICIKHLKYIQSHPKEFRFHPKLINEVIKKVEKS
ncbi:MAG TPA: hypothetical protein VGB37_04730, partial [Candidatus Lokiarchaeia archaeon]